MGLTGETWVNYLFSSDRLFETEYRNNNNYPIMISIPVDLHANLYFRILMSPVTPVFFSADTRVVSFYGCGNISATTIILPMYYYIIDTAATKTDWFELA